MKIYIRVDANKIIGSGHFVRCLTLALEIIKKSACHICFLCNDIPAQYIDILNINGISLKLLSNDREKEMLDILDADLPDLLIIDSDKEIFHETEFQNSVKSKKVKLMLITIRSDCFFTADIIVNQNIIALNRKYDTAEHTKTLLGPEYFIFNDKIKQAVPKSFVKSVPPFKIFVAFGSSDPANNTLKIFDVLNGINEYTEKVILVAGSLNQNINEIKEKINKHKDICIDLHIDTKKIYDLMVQTDFAITSASMMFWELAVLNVPSFIITSSSREKEYTDHLHQAKYCYKLCDFDNFNSTSEISGTIREIIEQGIDKHIKVGELKDMINIYGVEKVADEIIRII